MDAAIRAGQLVCVWEGREMKRSGRLGLAVVLVGLVGMLGAGSAQAGVLQSAAVGGEVSGVVAAASAAVADIAVLGRD